MVVIKHEGIEIKYDEFKNRWKVDDETNGITLDRVSLEEAKKGVTQALKNKGKGRHTRFKAWTRGGWGMGKAFELVTVTSLAEAGSTYHNREEAWITYPKVSEKSRTRREKTVVSYLYKDTAINRQRIEKITTLNAQADKLSDKAKSVEEKLDVIVIKKGEKKNGD